VPGNVFVSSNPETRIIKNLQYRKDKAAICHKDFNPYFINDLKNEYSKKLKALGKKGDINSEGDILTYMTHKQATSAEPGNRRKKKPVSLAVDWKNKMKARQQRQLASSLDSNEGGTPVNKELKELEEFIENQKDPNMQQILFGNLKNAQEQPGAYGDLSIQGVQGLRKIEGLKEVAREPFTVPRGIKLATAKAMQAEHELERLNKIKRYVDEQQARIGLTAQRADQFSVAHHKIDCLLGDGFPSVELIKYLYPQKADPQLLQKTKVQYYQL
jgi:hypothetical protein